MEETEASAVTVAQAVIVMTIRAQAVRVVMEVTEQLAVPVDPAAVDQVLACGWLMVLKVRSQVASLSLDERVSAE